MFQSQSWQSIAPERDYQLFLEVFLGGSWTKADPKKKARMEEVLEKCIKPFYFGKTDDQLYLVKLGQGEKSTTSSIYGFKQRKNARREIKSPSNTADNPHSCHGTCRTSLSRLLWLYRNLDPRRTKVGKILLEK